MNLEQEVRGYSIFSIETTDEEIFINLVGKIKPNAEDIYINDDEKEFGNTLYTLTIRSARKLISALRGEYGSYKVWAKRKENHRISKLILEKNPEHIVLAE